MELAIDTSSSTCSLCLSHKGELLSELSWQTTKNHTVETTSNLVCLLSLARAKPDSLEAVIVAKGPGSFNGLRVGMSIAKGLALSLNIPILGISTLEAEAYPFACTRLPLRPIHEAGRGEIATALYQEAANGWLRREEECLTTVENLCRHTRQKTLFCGEIPPAIAEEIRQSLSNRAIIAQRLPRARFLSLLGWQKLSRGEKNALDALQPLYLRPPHITKPQKRSTALNGKSEFGR
ncbi:MAG: tRNA (adenosine(37)-N6)-threonylcarbamoyltransferase complex dimerization subunit type 1 TsaB [Dehalococcoidia bacterium]|nr:tRNA (adenosine(37)-N6)-threonylcarbamoyltransferase complex dimerization subunit type 1 TsaB [Dehalococcoidia bacterium]